MTVLSFGVYFHIPYCFSRCRYCDFYAAGAARAVPDAYVDALLRALAGFAAALPGPPDTVYLGGGTPSLLTPAQAARLISAAAPRPEAEVTLEANPETVTLERLQGYRAAGVNRLSIGVQSARDSQLRALGRPHTARQAAAAFEMARQAGFDNVSGDIMLALPRYSREEFDETLALIQEGGAAHISAYLLKIEPGSAFGRQPPAGLPDADQAAGFYLYAVERLTPPATGNTKSPALPGPAGRGGTTASTGTVGTIWVWALPPTAAWGASVFITPPTPPLSWPGRPVRRPTGAAAPRITSSSSCGWPAGWTWRNTAAGAGWTSPPGSVPSWPTASRRAT